MRVSLPRDMRPVHILRRPYPILSQDAYIHPAILVHIRLQRHAHITIQRYRLVMTHRRHIAVRTAAMRVATAMRVAVAIAMRRRLSNPQRYPVQQPLKRRLLREPHHELVVRNPARLMRRRHPRRRCRQQTRRRADSAYLCCQEFSNHERPSLRASSFG